ncbi:glycerophosphodiester phosphodiesterase family protein [Enterococcus diestrammenae]|uniref:glycerophosphodiester phosphodiesterase family protein n=1 Tax=Enterococcus diestrammenae TaxID=1155073 RepID=UPI0022E6C5E1|nr:glycerophosphodiester phosphodiesterase family protein [Enterococcus diestrammenae]
MADVLRFDIAKDPKGNPITYGRVGDTDGLTRSVKVFEDGKPLDLTGYVITFEGNTSKYKTKVFDTGGVSIVDAAKGEFNYTFPNMAFAVEGQYERAYFSFANADKRMTTADFQVIVFGNSDIDAEEAETIITEYNRLLAELHEKQDAYIEEMDQTFLSLTQQLEDLQAQIDDVVARLEAGDFYTKEESDGKYATEQDIANLTKVNVGLGNVENYAIATDADAIAGLANTSYMTPKKTALAVEKQVFKGTDGGVQYIAHRGSNADYPENSVLAFEAVTRHWGIETDIQVTSDGTWVCMHDSTVDRTTDGTGTVASKTLAQIRALTIDTGNNLASLTDDQKRVPTFDEFLTVCKKNQRVPIIEIKTGDYSAANYDAVVTSLVKFNLTQVAVFISFDRQALIEVKKRLPAAPVQYLVNSITDQVISDAKALGTNASISVKYNDSTVTATNIIKIHNAGINAGCWTVPDTHFEAIVAMGFDYITTDSKSGNLRWAEVTLGSGITAESISKVGPSCVEETEDGGLHLHFAIRGGDNVRGTVFLTLPNWAIPMWSKWLVCTIRTNGGTATASFDITGIAEGASVSSLNAGEVKTSYGWDARLTWAAADVKYSKY